MSDPLLIGIAGKRGSGKDTTFRALGSVASAMGLKAERRAFADKLKLSFARIFYPDIGLEQAVELCNTLKEDGYVDLAVESGKGAHASGREALQRYGTEAHRDVFGSEFWVNALLPFGSDGHPDYNPRWHHNFDYADVCAITDVRFENEAARVLSLGGIVVKVVRPLLEEQRDAHASEKELPEVLITGTILNDGTYDQLIDQAADLLDGSVDA
jgi:hypothetical protein